jgi:phage-related protein (TIGR01555 family)
MMGGQLSSQAMHEQGAFTYYGATIDPSRVKTVTGIAMPPPLRQQLTGWGISELESCLREINAFLKLEGMIFELIDEAKVDVYKIEGLNEALMSAKGTEMIMARIGMSNRLKNYQNAIVMDMGDEYTQKQLGTVYNGLSQIYEQIRMNLAAAVRFPLDKLFGQSATGLNACGEVTIEMYNAIVEIVRQKAEPLLKWIIDLRCRALFGFEVDFEIEWPTLRVLSGTEAETVATSKQARAVALYNLGLMTPENLEKKLKMDGLISVELEREPVQMGEDGNAVKVAGGGAKNGAKEYGKQKEKPKPKGKEKAGARMNGLDGLRERRRERRGGQTAAA